MTYKGHPPAGKKRTTKVDAGNNHSYGTSSEKIKVGKHKKQSIGLGRGVPYLDNEYVQKNFAENYGFTRKASPRVSVSRWELAHITGGTAHIDTVHPTERAMAQGHSSGFKGTKAFGKYRLSGSHKAHRIGKR